MISGFFPVTAHSQLTQTVKRKRNRNVKVTYRSELTNMTDVKEIHIEI